MATGRDLVNAVRESLEADGELGRIKADMQRKVLDILDGSSTCNNRIRRPNLPRDVGLINELIREYLDWIGYKYSHNIFLSESDLPRKPLDRGYVLQDLGLSDSESTRKLPLLFSLIETFKML